METLILYGQLFWQFFKTGLFAVGGGLATLPFLQEMSRLDPLVYYDRHCRYGCRL